MCNKPLPESPLRLGLIGAGGWGTNYVRTIRQEPGIELSWIADPDSAVTERFSDVCPVFSGWRDALAETGADGVIIAAPPQFHAECAVAAIQAKIPVLVEKPLALAPKAARALLDAAERASVHVEVGHVHLFSPAYRRLKAEVAALGPVKRLQSRGGRWGPFRDDVSALWDWGPHDLAYALDLIGGTPQRLECEKLRSEPVGTGMGEVVAIEMEFAGGAVAGIEIGNLFSAKHRWLRLEAGAETFVLDDAQPDKLIRGPAGPQGPNPGTPVPVANTPPLTCLVRAFTDSIRAQSSDLEQLRLGVKVVELLDRCDQVLAAQKVS